MQLCTFVSAISWLQGLFFVVNKINIGMIGAIIGDIVGSRFEFDNTNDFDFELFAEDCAYTDDSICTVAVADELEVGNGGALVKKASGVAVAKALAGGATGEMIPVIIK